MPVFFITSACFAGSVFETKNLLFSIDTYFRQDLVTLKNTLDLDNGNSDDTTTYLGIDYNLGFNLEAKSGRQKFYLKLERNGPSDYSAPLFMHNTLVTSGGFIDRYRRERLLPQVEEFWFDTLLPRGLGFKIGLYTYEVGNGIALNGSFENYGFTLYNQAKDSLWRFYYCRPELLYKTRHGPHVPQDKEQGFEHNHSAANFFAVDARFKLNKSCFNPYLGALVDYTSSGKSDNIFTTPPRKDILGTVGSSWELKQDKITFNLEFAHNFGKATSEDPAYKDVYHSGYFAYTKLDYQMNKPAPLQRGFVTGFTPYLQFLLCSGNEVTPEMAQNQDETLTSAKNRAFSYTSPLNKNLGDSISGGANSSARPVVAMASGGGINYGLPRPKTFYSSDFENLVIPSLGFILELEKKISLGLDAYYLRSFAKPVGTLDGAGKYLSPELGYELDLFLDYQLNKNILIGFLGGYFLPGSL